MYFVYDNDRLADCSEIKVDKSWIHPVCVTFKDAQMYAKKWLGAYDMMVPTTPNTIVQYSGYGDTIEIREVV